MSGAEQQGEQHGPGHALERLIFFSDAVFAIAITLLVIDLHVPHVEQPAQDIHYVAALARMIPNFIGFLTSFFVIGAFWMGHHRAMDCARHWSPRLFVPNLLLLCAIAAMPFFTAFSSQYYGQRLPVALYCGWLALTALFNIRVQRIATAPPVVAERVPAEQRRTIRQRGIAVALGAATGFVVALFQPYLGQVALVSIPLWRLLLRRLAPTPAA